MKEKIKEKKLYLTILTITLLVLVMPLIIREVAYQGLPAGDYTYYHMRIAEYLKNTQQIPENEPLMDRVYSYNPYPFILAITSTIMNLEMAAKIIPILFGILSMIFFYIILKNFDHDEKKTFFICLLLALSPPFIYTFSTSTHYSLIIFLNILGFYLFIQKPKIYTWLAIFVFATIPFFNFFNALVTLILLTIYTISTKTDKHKLYIVSAGIILKTIAYHTYMFYKFGLPQEIATINASILQNLISDIGAKIGFSFFTILLEGVGLIITWKKKKEFNYIYALALILIISSMYFGEYTNIYTNFIVVILAGYGFFFLTDRTWQIKVIKSTSLLIIICGILFSTISYTTRIATTNPTPNEAKSLQWLEQNSKETDKILSHYSNGFYIQYFAKRQTLLDPYFEYTKDLQQKYADTETIFKSRTLITTKQLLDQNNIKYIWINSEMKKGLVWTQPEQGLLFLFTNNETFKNVYSKDVIEIWEYKTK